MLHVRRCISADSILSLIRRQMMRLKNHSMIMHAVALFAAKLHLDRFLHSESQHCKPGKQTSQHHSQSVCSADLQSRTGPLASRASKTCRVCKNAILVARGGRSGGGRARRIDSLRVERAARMLLATIGAAGVIATCLDALGTPFRADKVGQREGVFGYVGLLVITTEASVRERFLLH